MSSPKTPVQSDREEEPPPSMIKRLANWIIPGSAKKRQRLSSPKDQGQQVGNPDDVDTGDSNKTPRSQPLDTSTFLSPVNGSLTSNFTPPPQRTQTNTNEETGRGTNETPLTGSQPLAFNIGSNKSIGLTNPSFKKIQFDSKTIHQSSRPSNNSTAVRLRRSTPFQKRQLRNKVSFQKSGIPTPASKRTFVKTPFKYSANGSRNGNGNVASAAKVNALHAGVTPYKSTNRYRPSSRILTGAIASAAGATPGSKLSNLSQKNSALIAKRILSKQNISPKKSDGVLFKDPTSTQKISVRRVLGRNQDGSRVSTGVASAGEVIHSRRESAKKGAFVGDATTGSDYWSNVNQHIETSNFSSPPPQNSREAMEDAEIPEQQSTKRMKVSFSNLTPPGGKSSKEVATSMPMMSAEKARRMPTKATPYKVQSEVKYVTLREDADAIERDEHGIIHYTSETLYGNVLDYEKAFGGSCKGVPENEITNSVMNRVEEWKKNGGVSSIKFFKKNRPTASSGVGSVRMNGNEDAVPKSSTSALPFSFMPKTKPNRKGASSILNKPIGKSKEPTSASISKSTPAPSPAPTTTAPLPANGWGNLFQRFEKKPGEWKCDACCVTNPKDAAKCLACEAQRPEGAGEPTESKQDAGIQSGKKIEPSGTVGFTFAAPSSEKKSETPSTGGFTFAAPSADKKTEKPSTGGFTFAAPSVDKTAEKPSTGGFTFGAPPLEKKAEKPATGGFSFGTSSGKKDEVPVTGGFTFKVPEAEPAASGLTFEASSSEKKVEAPAAGGFAFGAPSSEKKDEAPAAGSFAFGAPSSVKKAEAPATVSFTFGASSSENKADVPATGGFTFGSSSEKKSEVPATGGFAFGLSSGKEGKEGKEGKDGKDSGATPKLPDSIAKESAIKKDEKASAPLFSFGAGASTAGEGGVSKPALPFGSTPALVDNSAPKTQFAFGSIPSVEKDTNAQKAPFAFGAASHADDVSTTKRKEEDSSNQKRKKRVMGGDNSISFGSSNSATPGPSFSFGAGKKETDTSSSSKAAFAFGSGVPSVPPTAPVITPAPPANGGFSFGASSNPAPASTGAAGFSFGQNSSSLPAQNAGGGTFAFGAGSAPAPAPTPAPLPASGAPFTFGGGGSTPASTSPVPFGSTPAAPVNQFGGPTAPSAQFGFGQQAPVQPSAPAFAFGAQPTPPPPAMPTGQVGFGQQAPPMMGGAPPPGGGFSIGKSSSGGNRGRAGRRIIRAKRPPSGR